MNDQEHQKPDNARPPLGSKAGDSVNSKLSLAKHSVIVTNLPSQACLASPLCLDWTLVVEPCIASIAILNGARQACAGAHGLPCQRITSERSSRKIRRPIHQVGSVAGKTECVTLGVDL
jgi:hypothetical protein